LRINQEKSVTPRLAILIAVSWMPIR
jgi:hypothetical protein